MLCSILKQLTEGKPSLVGKLEEFQLENKDKALNVNDYTKLLRSVIGTFSTVYIIIDALDEFSTVDEHRQELTEVIISLYPLPATNCRIFVSSRPSSDIEALFGADAQIVIAPDKKDISAYVNTKVGDSRRFKPWLEKDHNLLARIRDAIIEKSQEM